MSDRHLTIQDQIAEGNLVAANTLVAPVNIDRVGKVESSNQSIRRLS
jgi:hypothetical protein